MILPGPGQDPKAEKVFCRKHVKNILKSLKAKRHLTRLIFPKSKNRQIEVFLPASKIGELQFPNGEKGCLEFPNKEGVRNRCSPIKTLRNSSSPINEGIQATLGISPPAQLELKERIKELLSYKQGQLKKGLELMPPKELVEVGKALGRVCRYEPKARVSEQAKAYAVLRFLQEGEAITRPQAWLDQVARAREREIYGARNHPQAVADHGAQKNPAQARAVHWANP